MGYAGFFSFSFFFFHCVLSRSISDHSVNLNLYGLLVIRQIEYTSPGGAPGGILVPGSHKRLSQELWICALLKATANVDPAEDRTWEVRVQSPTLYPCASSLHIRFISRSFLKVKSRIWPLQHQEYHKVTSYGTFVCQNITSGSPTYIEFADRCFLHLYE